MRRELCVAAVALAVLVGGCGGSDSGSDRMVRTGEADPKAAADGRLTSNPAPLTLKSLDEVEEGSPEQAVMTLLFWAQWGNIPAVVDAYDPQVIDALGVTAITSAYSWLRSSLVVSQPRLVSVKRTGENTFVGVELRTTTDAPQRESFVMHRVGDEWRVRYDTLLDRGINGAVITRLNPDPTAKRQPDKVLAEAAAAAQTYRDTYPSLALQERDESRNR
jgi:hypothetical protein